MSTKNKVNFLNYLRIIASLYEKSQWEFGIPPIRQDLVMSGIPKDAIKQMEHEGYIKSELKSLIKIDQKTKQERQVGGRLLVSLTDTAKSWIKEVEEKEKAAAAEQGANEILSTDEFIAQLQNPTV